MSMSKHLKQRHLLWLHLLKYGYFDKYFENLIISILFLKILIILKSNNSKKVDAFVIQPQLLCFPTS